MVDSPSFSRRRAVRVAAMFVLVAIGLAIFLLFSRRADSRRSPEFLNTEREVRYVGSNVCAECHAEAAEQFRESPMGRSAFTISDSIAARSPGEQRVAGLGIPFNYRVVPNGGKVDVTETMFDREEKEVYSQTEQLAYAFGSGTHGQTYVIARPGGYLFESPITWYRALDGWAMSPGYEDAQHSRFGRTIAHECAFCHTGRARPVQGTFNRFDPDQPFDEIAISCERCHGPGELHVERYDQGKKLSGKTIVNPKKLTPQRAADVCFQCHRSESETITVMRASRTWTDFRPGMSISEIIQEFSDRNAPEQPGVAGVHFSGKFTQLKASRCFTESGGELHCLTCHSIHSRPAAEHEVEHYRQKCLSCHADAGCSVPESTRIALRPDDACYQCHMPATVPVEIQHTTITDHRIRKPGQEALASTTPDKRLARLEPVLAENVGGKELKRNLGIAYLQLGIREPASRERYVRTALALMDGVQDEFQDDFSFQLFRGQCLQILGLIRPAISAFEAAVRLEPDNEYARLELARAQELIGSEALAREQFGKVQEIDPYHPYMLHALGRLEVGRGNLRHAEQLYRSILSLNEGDAEALLKLGRLLVRQGNSAEGKKLLARYLQLHPDDESMVKTLSP